MKTTDGYEHRRFSRIPFHTDVQLNFHLEREVQTAHLLDISLNGALVETERPIFNAFKGKICSMTLLLGKGGELITMEGKMAFYQEGQLMGIECQHIDVDSMSKLRRLVELNTGDERLVDRDLAEVLKSASAGAKAESQ